MKIKYFFPVALLCLLTVNFAEASSLACDDIQRSAKTETTNGQSNIAKQSIMVSDESRLYFYSAPDEMCKQEDAFVIKGDFLYAYKIHEDFTYVNYLTSKGNEVKGWVKNAGLKAFTPTISDTYKKNMTIPDFIAVKNNDWFGLGGSFSSNKLLTQKKEISSGFIGDFPNDSGGLNKFYSHAYKDFTVVSSNADYDKRLWTIDDDYIVSNITLSTTEYHTIRNVKVGDTKEKVLNRYKGIQFRESDGKLIYTLGTMTLTFNLNNDIITSIEMSAVNDEE